MNDDLHAADGHAVARQAHSRVGDGTAAVVAIQRHILHLDVTARGGGVVRNDAGKVGSASQLQSSDADAAADDFLA